MTQRPYALAAIAAITGAALGALLAVGHAGGPNAGTQSIAQPQPVAPQLAQPQPQPSTQYATPAEEPGAAQREESVEPIRDLSLGA